TNILVVEDDDLIRSVLVKALGGAEYTALEAGDGESARAILSTISDIDLMLLDIGLPNTDGLTLLREARNRGSNAPVTTLAARHGRSRHGRSHPGARVAESCVERPRHHPPRPRQRRQHGRGTGFRGEWLHGQAVPRPRTARS